MASRQIFFLRKNSQNCLKMCRREYINSDMPCTLTHKQNSKLSCYITPCQTILRYVQFPVYGIPWAENDTTWYASGFMGTSNEFFSSFRLSFPRAPCKKISLLYLNMKCRSKCTFSFEI